MLESAVLKAKQPGLEDHEWQEFCLRDVRVYKKRSSTKFVSLLTAETDRPIIVVGVLEEVEPEQQALLLTNEYKRDPVVISGVTQYALGEFAEGGYCIWAAGEAGWYAIEPAAEYRPIHQESLEAVKIFYFLKDFYADEGSSYGKNQLGVSEQVLFEQYAKNPKMECSDFSDAVEVFTKHREFLLSMMRQNEDELDSIDYIPWSKTTIFRWMLLMSSKKSTSTYTIFQPAVATFDEFEIVRKASMDLVHEDLGLASVVPQMSLSFADKPFKNSAEISDYLVAHAAEVVTHLQDASLGHRYRWVNTRMYRELQALTRTPSIDQTGRRSLTRASISTPQAQEPPAKKHKIGQLRLQNGQFGSKAIARKAGLSRSERPETPTANNKSDDDIHWPSTTREKERSSLPHPKRSLEFETPWQDAQVLSASTEDHTPEYGFLLPMAEERISLYDSKKDTWDCPLDGCLFKVRDLLLVENVQRIQDHISKHARRDPDGDGKLNTVYTESRSHLPISHLVDKIRSMAKRGQ